MELSRTQVLTGVLLFTILFAAMVLAEVLWTALFGVTVAYVLVPGVSWLRDRGLPTWAASLLATLIVTLGVGGLFGIVAFLVYRRRDAIIDFITTFPETVVLEGFGYSYVITIEAVLEAAVTSLSGYAVLFATMLPSVLLKLTVFAFVVYGLLFSHEEVEDAVMSTVPNGYRDIAGALAERTRDTLYAIYVLQAATGAGTFLLALPVFFLLGYDIPVTLSFLAGVLQFVPIVGPSFLLAALAAYHVVAGEVIAAVLVVVVGGVVIAWLPDILIRPRLAEIAGRLPGSLYLVGFLGGLLTVGPIGIVAGPLAVALVVESVSLLAASGGPTPE